MFVVRIVVLRELIEGSDPLKHAGFEVFGQSVNASRHNDQTTDESRAEPVIKLADASCLVESADITHRRSPRLRFCTATCDVRRTCGSHHDTGPTTCRS